MKKFLAATLAAGALATAAAGVAIVNPLGTAGAQSSTPAPPSTTAERPIGSVLSGLVADGTITQQQADTIETRLREFREAHRPIRNAAKDAVSVAATTIGVDVGDLRSELRAGKSVATVAAEHGVDEKAVVDAVVADLANKLDQAAAKGTITPERAGAVKAKLTERVTKLVETVRGQHG
jgi:ribosomal protein S20